MSIYVTNGGGGQTSTALGQHASGSLSLFTTPSVSNTLYLYTITRSQEENIVEWAGNASQASATAISTVEQASMVFTGKAGPGATVYCAYGNQSDTNDTVYFTYTYVGIVIDTN